MREHRCTAAFINPKPLRAVEAVFLLTAPGGIPNEEWPGFTRIIGEQTTSHSDFFKQTLDSEPSNSKTKWDNPHLVNYPISEGNPAEADEHKF